MRTSSGLLSRCLNAQSQKALRFIRYTFYSTTSFKITITSKKVKVTSNLPALIMLSSVAHVLLALGTLAFSVVSGKQARHWGRRVYSTDILDGFAKGKPSLWPPGHGGEGAAERIILDVGANNGDQYTLHGFQKGHMVFSFEPSPMLGSLFRDVMKKHKVDTAFVKMRIANDTKKYSRRTVTIPYGNKAIKPKVYYIPVALSNQTGAASLHQSPCADLSKCGKSNRLVMDHKKGSVRVPVFRFDDVILPVDKKNIWFMKIDVEGHELQVLQGARDLLKNVQVPYIALEMSSNGRKGIDWGVGLLDELHYQGYVCHHLRGFGRCHDSTLKSPSLKCNYPFSLTNKKNAPTFEEYVEVFQVKNGHEKKKRALADLMCVHKRIL